MDSMQIKSYLLFRKIVLPAVILSAIAITMAGCSSITPRPCDLYASTTPCVAAFSTTRALYRTYKGPLYEVTRQSDKTSINISLAPDGYADAARAHLTLLLVHLGRLPWDAPAERKRVRPALPGSFEALFHELGTPRFLLDLPSGGGAQALAGARAGGLSEQGGLREILSSRRRRSPRPHNHRE